MTSGSARFIYLATGSLIASLAMAAPAVAGTGGEQPPAEPGAAPEQSAQAPAAAPNPASASGDIVVTALRRSENLQDVPAAITAFTSDTIEAAGIEKPIDFINLTSNVNLVETQNAGNAFIIIRGITQARNSEPSVAVVVDGVQQANPAQFNQEVFDIEQIEVLKGPQGALYGRNAIGGAIVIRTRQPSDHLEGQVKAGIDNGFG
jgi:iron complex outermembrane receptor protein